MVITRTAARGTVRARIGRPGCGRIRRVGGARCRRTATGPRRAGFVSALPLDSATTHQVAGIGLAGLGGSGRVGGRNVRGGGLHWGAAGVCRVPGCGLGWSARGLWLPEREFVRTGGGDAVDGVPVPSECGVCDRWGLGAAPAQGAEAVQGAGCLAARHQVRGEIPRVLDQHRRLGNKRIIDGGKGRHVMLAEHSGQPVEFIEI